MGKCSTHLNTFQRELEERIFWWELSNSTNYFFAMLIRKKIEKPVKNTYKNFNPSIALHRMLEIEKPKLRLFFHLENLSRNVFGYNFVEMLLNCLVRYCRVESTSNNKSKLNCVNS